MVIEPKIIHQTTRHGMYSEVAPLRLPGKTCSVSIDVLLNASRHGARRRTKGKQADDTKTFLGSSTQSPK